MSDEERHATLHYEQRLASRLRLYGVNRRHNDWSYLFTPVCNICNVLQGFLRKTRLMKSATQRFTILDNMSSILYPGRLTLLLGPPGAGKTTLLNALSGRLQNSSHVDVRLEPFLPCQYSLHSLGLARCVALHIHVRKGS